MVKIFMDFPIKVDYKEAESLAELRYMVGEYMEHYNNKRKQWTLKKMTPST